MDPSLGSWRHDVFACFARIDHPRPIPAQFVCEISSNTAFAQCTCKLQIEAAYSESEWTWHPPNRMTARAEIWIRVTTPWDFYHSHGQSSRSEDSAFWLFPQLEREKKKKEGGRERERRKNISEAGRSIGGKFSNYEPGNIPRVAVGLELFFFKGTFFDIKIGQ